MLAEPLYPEQPPGPCICEEKLPIEEIVPRVPGTVVTDCPAHGEEHSTKTLIGSMMERGVVVRDDSEPTGFRPGGMVVGPAVKEELEKLFEERDKATRRTVITEPVSVTIDGEEMEGVDLSRLREEYTQVSWHHDWGRT